MRDGTFNTLFHVYTLTVAFVFLALTFAGLFLFRMHLKRAGRYSVPPCHTHWRAGARRRRSLTRARRLRGRVAGGCGPSGATCRWSC